MLKTIKDEIKTQERVIKLFQEKLGYTYLGNYLERENSNIEEELLIKFLKKQGYSQTLIKKAIYELKKLAENSTRSLYDLNKEIYSMLRYGAKIKESVDKNKQSVFFIDWKNPTKNDFYIAEEVTIKGKHPKRPDIVLYINGIAIGVLELKKSTVAVSEGIRQNLDNQKPEFIKSFFNTIQLVMAGNNSEGLRYGVIETHEKYYLEWKEKSSIKYKYRLDKDLSNLCNKERIIEILYDFIAFDLGIKKICRHNQYFGVVEAQKYIKKREGGIIWHTQGSGKSLTMIWLAKWIIENRDDSRVLIITDRTELDRQIKEFFTGVGEKIYQPKSGRDLINTLNSKEKSLICSLIHKFGAKSETDYDGYIGEIKKNLPKNFKAKGDIYVFVDECHRTQSGKLHSAMKEILPNSIFIGFTGTPLLKTDKKTSKEVFGKYIHTYKYDEAVRDRVILDLQYEARNIEQKITSKEKIDAWFNAKTEGLTDHAKTELKKKWGTMQKILSSKSRLNRVATDIMFDMTTKPRLQTGRGNALLIAGNIYEACKYYEIFQNLGLKKCAIITSYNPSIEDIKGESVGDDEDTENVQKYEIYKKMEEYYTKLYPEIKTRGFEEVIKSKFVKEPGQMKLLIVVDKLLTGFDAPPATYLYIDQRRENHGLFQAICRVNRLDGEDKDYGYIVDYKDLFNSIDSALKDYTTGAFEGYDPKDVKGLLKNRVDTARENLENSLEDIRALCEPVKVPKDETAFQRFFCGNPENKNDLGENKEKRVALYKLTSKLVRAYANIANEMKEAGYTKPQTDEIRKEVKYYSDIRTLIKMTSGEYIDLKSYEPAMRHLIDTYIDAEESKTMSALEEIKLLDLVVKNKESVIEQLPKNIRKNKEAVAEVIENNVRRLIIDERPTNPKYYENMSTLLEELILERRQASIKYSNYIQKIAELIKKIKNPSSSRDYPKSINSNAKRALYDNFGSNEDFVLALHENIMEYKTDSWRGNKIKTKQLKNGIIKTIKKFKLEEEIDASEALRLVGEQNEY